MNISSLDERLIQFFKKASIPTARIALFIVYVWFGVLKVLELSPASMLVQNLFDTTGMQITFGIFLLVFGLVEIVIGILFLFPKATRLVLPLLFLHMIATMLPLFLLPHEVWLAPFVPTLEGQYILKNLVIVACAFGIAAHLAPMQKKV